MSAIIKYTCPKHPKYKGIKSPRVFCNGCDVVYERCSWIGDYPYLRVERVDEK